MLEIKEVHQIEDGTLTKTMIYDTYRFDGNLNEF